MLKIIDYNSDEKIDEPCVVMLGYFDGMHIGHRALLRAAKERAEKEHLKVVIMTFYGGKKGAQIYIFEERVKLFEKLGVDYILAARFDEKFKSIDKNEFINSVFYKFNVKALVCGVDFTFGKNASGNVNDIKISADEHSASLIVMPPIDVYDRKAATSLAKEYLDSGDIKKLNKLLGDRYFICGKVSSEGRKVGTKLGFPTANLHISFEKYPLKQGVYAVGVELNGKEYKGIANYGSRPTFCDEQVVFEVYIVGFDGDIYGKEITVYIDERIRDIKKFASADELKTQLKKDLEKII